MAALFVSSLVMASLRLQFCKAFLRQNSAGSLVMGNRLTHQPQPSRLMRHVLRLLAEELGCSRNLLAVSIAQAFAAWKRIVQQTSGNGASQSHHPCRRFRCAR